jgi:hypothetical protein
MEELAMGWWVAWGGFVAAFLLVVVMLLLPGVADFIFDTIEEFPTVQRFRPEHSV